MPGLGQLPPPMGVAFLGVPPVKVHGRKEPQGAVQPFLIVPADHPGNHLPGLEVIRQCLSLQGLADRSVLVSLLAGLVARLDEQGILRDRDALEPPSVDVAPTAPSTFYAFTDVAEKTLVGVPRRA